MYYRILSEVNDRKRRVEMVRPHVAKFFNLLTLLSVNLFEIISDIFFTSVFSDF